MQLDQCAPYPATREFVARAVDYSSAWARRCLAAHTRPDQTLFGIVQGGMHLDLRLESVRRLREIEEESLAAGGRRFGGYGIGGYSVGEDHEVMFETLGEVARACPDEPAALPHGRGQPHHARARGARGRRHVRLRAAHPHGPHGHGVLQRRPHEPAQRQVRPRLHAARPGLRLPHLSKTTRAPTSGTS